MPKDEWADNAKAGLDLYPSKPVWGANFIYAIREIRAVEPNGLRDTLDLMANTFGFNDWPEWQPWLKEHNPDFTNIKGPHAVTLLKMLAIKHGRSQCCTLSDSKTTDTSQQ